MDNYYSVYTTFSSGQIISYRLTVFLVILHQDMVWGPDMRGCCHCQLPRSRSYSKVSDILQTV